MTAGYWAVNYFPTDYWVDDYWLDYGVVIPPDATKWNSNLFRLWILTERI